MSKLTFKGSKEVFLLVSICIFSLIFGLLLRRNEITNATSYSAELLQQSDEKVIDRKEFPNEPFKFSGLSIQKTKLDLNQKFSVQKLIEKKWRKS